MVYKWYILPIGGLYATYHLLGEPETTIDIYLTYTLKIHGLVLREVDFPEKMDQSYDVVWDGIFGPSFQWIFQVPLKGGR